MRGLLIAKSPPSTGARALDEVYGWQVQVASIEPSKETITWSFVTKKKSHRLCVSRTGLVEWLSS